MADITAEPAVEISFVVQIINSSESFGIQANASLR